MPATSWKPSSMSTVRPSASPAAGQARALKASSSTSSRTTGSATRWWHMRPSVFLSSISALAAAGCGDDNCGPGSAAAFGLLASSADVTLTYGNLTSGLNHDCPDSPDVEPLTIEGSQMD